MGKKAFIAAIIIMDFLVSLVAGMQTVNLAKANPEFFHDSSSITISSPLNQTYNESSLPLFAKPELAEVNNVMEKVLWLNYSLDGVSQYLAFGFIEAYTILSNLTDGSHFLMVYGETSFNYFISANVSFAVDTTPPVITNLLGNSTYHEGGIFLLSFTVNEPTSWMGYSLDNHSNVTVVSNTTLSNLSIGAHRLAVYANDTAGNMGKEEVVFFEGDLLPSPSPSLSPTPSLSPSLTQQPTIEPSPTPNNTQENFTPILIIAALVVMLVIVGLLFYFMRTKKQK